MQKLILNNDIEIQIAKDNPVDLDFSSGEWDSPFQSPNLNFIETYLAELKTTAKNNPVKYVYDFWKENGILAPLSARITDNDLEVVSGTVDVFNPDNYIDKVEGNKTSVLKIAIAEKRKTLEKKLQGINISTFYENQIKKSELKEVVAVLNSVPDYMAVALLTFALAYCIIETYRAAQDVVRNVAQLAASPAYLIASGGNVASTVVDIAIATAMLIIQTINLVLLTKSIYDNLIGDQRYYNCISYKKILDTLFAEVGYSFSSSIIDGEYKGAVIIAPSDNSGTTSKGSASNNPIPDISGLDFYKTISETFNGTLKVSENNTVQFERKDKFFNEANTEVKLPNLFNNGIERVNFSELLGSISIKYSRDPSDLNSISTRKRSIAVNFLLIGQNNFEKTKSINISYCRVSRKDGLNAIEDIYDSITDPIREIGGNIPDLSDRKGAMQISNFNLGVGVVFMYKDGGIDEDKEHLLDVNELYDKFHSIDNPALNQFFIHEELTEVPISLSDFKKLQYNNVAKDANNNTIYIQSNIRDSNGLHEMTYRRRIPSNSVYYIPQNKVIVLKTNPTS